MKKDMKVVVAEAVDRGWRVEHGKTHGKLIHPSGAFVFFSRTPSCCRAHLNVAKHLQRVENNTEMVS